MAFEDIQAELALLVDKLADHPQDTQELETVLRTKLAELKAFGLPLPDDLVALEAALDRALTEQAEDEPPATDPL